MGLHVRFTRMHTSMCACVHVCTDRRVHQVLIQSGVKLSVLHSLLPGTLVDHPAHGPGIVVGVIAEDKRNRPYLVRFSNGETHCYSLESAAKLRVDVEESPEPGAMLLQNL